ISLATPSTSTPALSHARISFSTSRSDTRSETNPIRASCEICPKQSVKSASSTQQAPLFAWVRTASNASCAERLGRNPKLTGRNCASKMGSRTIFAAVMTTRSRTVGMESGRGAGGCVGAEPLHESETVELEHALGSTGEGIEVKLVDLGCG